MTAFALTPPDSPNTLQSCSLMAHGETGKAPLGRRHQRAPDNLEGNQTDAASLPLEPSMEVRGRRLSISGINALRP